MKNPILFCAVLAIANIRLLTQTGIFPASGNVGYWYDKPNSHN